MKKVFVFFSFAVFFLTLSGFAHSQGLEIKKVSMTMNDGSVRQGFVFLDEVRDPTMDVKGFLKYYFDNPTHTTQFDFYPKEYVIHRSVPGQEGTAFCRDDREGIEAKTVKKIIGLPSSYDGQKYLFVELFPRDEIELMQNKLISTDYIEDSEQPGIAFTAFNYDPSISKKKLHQIIFKYLKSYLFWGKRHNEVFDDKALKKRMRWEKILFSRKEGVDD